MNHEMMIALTFVAGLVAGLVTGLVTGFDRFRTVALVLF